MMSESESMKKVLNLVEEGESWTLLWLMYGGDAVLIKGNKIRTGYRFGGECFVKICRRRKLNVITAIK